MADLDILARLFAIKAEYAKPEMRKPGWDYYARSDAIHAVVEHHFGKVRWDDDVTVTDAFIDVLIHLYEDEDDAAI